MRRTREGIGAALDIIAWPLKKAGAFLMQLGGNLINTGSTLYSTGRDISSWNRED